MCLMLLEAGSIFLTNINDYRTVNKIYSSYFNKENGVN